MEEPVTIIDRDVLKAISVDTRMDILKMLSEGDRTPSFIGKKLNKTDPTIVEHLDAMQKAGLVKKIETPGKKFVFYTLTERGHGIISSKSRRLIIILGISFLALSGGILNLLYSPFVSQTTLSENLPAAAPAMGNASKTIITIQQPFPWLSVFLFIIFIIGMAYYIKKKP
jgi:DNA-binding transcriptional ArsR family regulator